MDGRRFSSARNFDSGQWKRQLSKHGARGPLSVGSGAFSPVKSRKFKQAAAEAQELEGRWPAAAAAVPPA